MSFIPHSRDLDSLSLGYSRFSLVPSRVFMGSSRFFLVPSCVYCYHHHLFSFHRSVQDYKIQMDMEIVTFEGKQGVKPLQSVHQ
jgi:hypothetical protein